MVCSSGLVRMLQRQRQGKLLPIYMCRSHAVMTCSRACLRVILSVIGSFRPAAASSHGMADYGELWSNRAPFLEEIMVELAYLKSGGEG